MNINFSKKNLLQYLFVLTPFTNKIFGFDGAFSIDMFSYLFFSILFILQFRKHDINLIFISFFLLIFLLFYSLFLENNLFLFYKTSVPLFIILNSTFTFIKFNNIHDILNKYVFVSFFIAFFGIIQVLFKIYGINLYSNYAAIDLHSILKEPSHYVVVVIPALVYSYLMNYKRIIVSTIFLSLLLTFKLTFFIGFIILILLKAKRSLKIILTSSILTFGSAFYSIESYRIRLEPIFYYIENRIMPENLFGTPLSFFSNLIVAIYNAKNNFLGAGLGNHPESYYKYFMSHRWIGLEYNFGLNANSAHSLIIRVISELGFIGFLVILIIFFRGYLISRSNKFLEILFLCSISHFIVKSIKLGSYLDEGTLIWFSIIIFIYLKKIK